jgi:hypothetical protein
MVAGFIRGGTLANCATPAHLVRPVLLCVSAAAQEGYHGAGHDDWHQGSIQSPKEAMGGVLRRIRPLGTSLGQLDRKVAAQRLSSGSYAG